MFDPFGDFATAGYLRNHLAEKDLELIKIAEHQLFRARLPAALDYLAEVECVDYPAFLHVHQILFGGLYPWAGQDRATVAPDKHVTKGEVHFCHPHECRRAVEHALLLSRSPERMAASPGLIMGLFAYAHPFLDGNGRTMLVVHAELCYRAGMSVDWNQTRKGDYLDALSLEIEAPDRGHLDNYLLPYLGQRMARADWYAAIDALPGLDGSRTPLDAAACYDDPSVAAGYEEFEQARNYTIPD